MNTTETKGIALITGASSGIGAVYADRLAKRGHDLILVARNMDRLASLARRLTSDTGRKVETIQADLASPADLRRVEDILRTNAGISLLVNNAGFGATKPLLASDVDQMEEMIQLNVTAKSRRTERSPGSSSLPGRIPVARAVYSPDAIRSASVTSARIAFAGSQIGAACIGEH
jgi:uncharacterized protein